MREHEELLADRLSSVVIFSIAKLSTPSISFFYSQKILAIVNSNCFQLPCYSEVQL